MKEEIDLEYVAMCRKFIGTKNPIECLQRLKWCPDVYKKRVREEGIRIVGIKTLEMSLCDPPVCNYKIVWISKDNRVFSDLFSVYQEDDMEDYL